MKQQFCKYCKRPMAVSYLEYRSNAYCNQCFDERADNKLPKNKLNTFQFMGDIIAISKRKSENEK